MIIKPHLKIILVLIFFVAASCTNEKTRVLIIGDSISLGYTPFVKEDLKDIADVFHNPGNAKHSTYGLENIEAWIDSAEWDIIQFNWGLWDLCYRHPDSKVQGKRDKINGTLTNSLDDYEKNLEEIVKILKERTNAKLIFVTTTFVPENEQGRFTEDVLRYNEVARKVMEANNVLINDIYHESIVIHKKYGKGDDDVHYEEDGYRLLAKHISNFLKNEVLFQKDY